MSAEAKTYDDLFEKASEVIRQHNPCQIAGGTCAGSYKHDEGLCCQGCGHLGPEGCREKSLTCRLWLCWDIHVKHPEVSSALQAIERQALAAGVPRLLRGTREQHIYYMKQVTP